ncbi:MAG TPA: ISL3 family transposase [Ktedonobacteraceae bacterium]|nr:ISL3 family transposase [Ktedonobacteraceae bacterium]
MAKPTLLPDPTRLHLKLLDASETTITAVVTTTSEEAPCPLCHRHSTRIHSRYMRTVADLPWMGCAVRLELHVRRFFCTNQECTRQIFTERLPNVVAPYAHKTLRLTDIFTLIGFALGGEAGKRLVAGMGLSTSPDTLLRLIRAQPEEKVPTPRVLGVDDFSFCKRKTYGTILLDLERRIPIDILPDREATTLETWLKDHEGVEIISRDRGGPYAEGARKGAPEAQQVADRWHLLANLSDALKTFFAGKQAQLKALIQKPPETFSAEEEQQLPAWYSGQTKRKTEMYDAHHQERVERYHKVRELRAQGAELTLIAHQVGISRTTVNKYLNMEHPPARKTGKRSGSVIDPYKGYIVKRWNDGVRNAQQVYREIKEMGYLGSDQPIQRYFVQFRGEKDHRKFKQIDPTQETPVKAPPKRPPTASQVAHWITFKEEQRLEWQKKYLAQLCEADQEIREANELIQEFATMLREQKGECFDVWLSKVEQQGISELRSFAQSLKKDYEAVKAGLTLPWSQGPVEGHVHRLKLIKRQAYGRASFQTLRKRVLRCG